MVTETWRWQGGILRDDIVLGATTGPHGSSLLAGYTNVNPRVVSRAPRDWMAVKLDAEGTLLWRWQGGTSSAIQNIAAAMGKDGSVAVAGTVRGESNDFAAVKLDENGDLLWEWQDGSTADDTNHAVALTTDGSVILAGSTTGVWGEASIGSCDFAALKLDAEGNLLWTWQDGTEDVDCIRTVVVDDDDDSMVLAGYSSGNWSDTAPGGADFVAVKLDANGNELWRWQSGTTGYDACTTAVMGENGSVVLAGMTRSTWGTHAGGYSGFAAVKLNCRGDEVWRWQDGTARRDIFRAAAMGDQGSVVLAGITYETWGKSSEGRNAVAAVKLDANGVEVWRWQDYSAEAVPHNPAAIAVGNNGVMLLAGSTAGSWKEESSVRSDFGAVKLDLGTSLTGLASAGVPSDAGDLITLPPPSTGLSARRARNSRSSPSTIPPTPPSSSASPAASATGFPPPELRSRADALVSLASTPEALPTPLMSNRRLSVFPQTLDVSAPPPVSPHQTQFTPAWSSAVSTMSQTHGRLSGTDSVITSAQTPADPPITRMLTSFLSSITPSPTLLARVSSEATTPPLTSPAQPSPAQPSPAPTSPASTSLAPTSPPPTSPTPTYPAPTPTTPTSRPPTSPPPTSPPPTSPPPTSPPPTSPPPTSPPPTSPPPTSPKPTSQPPTSPPPTSPPPSSPPPTSLSPSSPRPTSPPSISQVPTLPPTPTLTSPAPTSLPPTPPPPTVPISTSPSPQSPTPQPPAPTIPAPTSPAPTPPAPTSPAPTTPAPTSQAPAPLALASPSPTSPPPASPPPTPLRPTSPVPRSSPPKSPAPTSLASTSPPTSTAPTSPAPASSASITPAPTSPTPDPSVPTPSAPTSPSPASPAQTSRAPTSPIAATSNPVPPPQTPVDARNITTPSPGMASPAPSLATSTPESSLSAIKIVAVCTAAAVAVIVLGAYLCLRKRQNAKKEYNVQEAPHSARNLPGFGLDGNQHGPPIVPVVGAANESTGLPLYLPNTSDPEVVPAASCPSAESSPTTRPPTRSAHAPPVVYTKEAEDDALPALDLEYGAAKFQCSETLLAMGSFSPISGNDVAQAVAEAGHRLALNSQIPGVCEAATLVLILVNLISDDKSCSVEVETRIKRCRLVIMILQRASMVLGKVSLNYTKGIDVKGDMERMLIEDVQTAVGDMVELIKTYRSKGRISQVIVSTMFRRRMEEAEAVIDRAISDLKLGLHVHSEVNQEKNRQTVHKHWRNLNQRMHILDENGEDTTNRLQRKRRVTQRLPSLDENGGGVTDGLQYQQRAAESMAESLASARRLRRQRNLSQIEIPEDHVTISDELLGKGGFGSVYIADYNGRNAAAKVVNVDITHCDLSDRHVDDAKKGVSNHGINANHQCASLLSEVQTMMRLRSPHTVNVYGAITSGKDRLVLVMELLTGGDLRCFLRHAEERLPESLARQIIGDVCAGMAFLHSKSAVHGDLKSPNILLDGETRAKIADFGTSRWARHSDSTGLATHRTNAENVIQMMSFAWAAPEVLYAKGSSYASDVYSFGVVAWEVLSMEVPWAGESLPIDIYRRVVFKGDRLVIPANAPADITDIVRACWAGKPGERPTSGEIAKRLSSHSIQG